MTNLQQLLDKTSRTFALAIPLLPEPTRSDVTLAYLVFRIADTFEDAENLSSSAKRGAIEEFVGLLHDPCRSRAENFARKWTAKQPTTNTWYMALLTNTQLVLDELATRNVVVRRCIINHVQRTAIGMQSFLRNETVRVGSLGELRRYCYFVAGIVGEMLTEIFAERIDRFSDSPDARREARAFGEALQLVNILKDQKEDLRCGRQLVPKNVKPEAIFDLVRENMLLARLYVDRLRRADAPSGYVAFTQLPLELASETLDRVERFGPGAKVPRDQVAKILASLPSTSGPKPVVASPP